MKKKLNERMAYPENQKELSQEAILKVFASYGWEKIRDWAGRDDYLTFVQGDDRISFDLDKYGYGFTYYYNFTEKEYEADYAMFTGEDLYTLKQDLIELQYMGKPAELEKYEMPEYEKQFLNQINSLREHRTVKGHTRFRETGVTPETVNAATNIIASLQPDMWVGRDFGLEGFKYHWVAENLCKWKEATLDFNDDRGFYILQASDEIGDTVDEWVGCGFEEFKRDFEEFCNENDTVKTKWDGSDVSDTALKESHSPEWLDGKGADKVKHAFWRWAD